MRIDMGQCGEGGERAGWGGGQVGVVEILYVIVACRG